MIIFSPKSDHHFSEFGIEIPIVDDRAQRVFDELKKDFPALSYTDLSLVKKLSKEDLLLSHNVAFVDRLFGSDQEMRKELLTSYELVNTDGSFNRYNPDNQKKEFSILRDTILSQASMTAYAAELALTHGFTFHLGGGMHHAMSFGGRGFCLVSDITIALKKLQKAQKIKHAWIIDVDVHKGDGAPEILKGDSSISTFSIHMKNGWPLDSGFPDAPWFTPSTLDVAIDINEEHLYLERLEAGLLELEKKTPRPDLVLVVNGADPFEFDELKSAELIKLTKEQMLLRDKLVYNFFKSREIPQTYVMAGGYGKRSWEIYHQFLADVLASK